MSQTTAVHDGPGSPCSPATILHGEPRCLPSSRTAPPVHGVSATHAATWVSRRVTSQKGGLAEADLTPPAASGQDTGGVRNDSQQSQEHSAVGAEADPSGRMSNVSPAIARTAMLSVTVTSRGSTGRGAQAATRDHWQPAPRPADDQTALREGSGVTSA